MHLAGNAQPTPEGNCAMEIGGTSHRAVVLGGALNIEGDRTKKLYHYGTCPTCMQ
jgi:hypothetical protein